MYRSLVYTGEIKSFEIDDGSNNAGNEHGCYEEPLDPKAEFLIKNPACLFVINRVVGAVPSH